MQALAAANVAMLMILRSVLLYFDLTGMEMLEMVGMTCGVVVVRVLCIGLVRSCVRRRDVDFRSGDAIEDRSVAFMVAVCSFGVRYSVCLPFEVAEGSFDVQFAGFCVCWRGDLFLMSSCWQTNVAIRLYIYHATLSPGSLKILGHGYRS